MHDMNACHDACGAVWIDAAGSARIAHYGDPAAEYQAARHTVAVLDRSDRGLLEIRGGDRAAWLHNLTTHDIKSLRAGAGRYCFALNVKGRILFDANVLALDEHLWLDVDRRWLGPAQTHLNRYIISEDVTLSDRSSVLGRLALIGPNLLVTLRDWGVPAVASLEPLQHQAVIIAGQECRLVRHDGAGPLGVELIVAADGQPAVWQSVIDGGAVPVGWQVLQQLRVESGVPASCSDLDAEVLPAETGQLARAVSFQKGCYLGQEVVERMRAHRSVARQWVGLRFTDPPATEPPLALTSNGQTVGRVTSAARSPALGQCIGLGYVKAALARSGIQLQTGDGSDCTVCDLPFVSTCSTG